METPEACIHIGLAASSIREGVTGRKTEEDSLEAEKEDEMKRGALVERGKQGVQGLLQELLLRPSSVCSIVSTAINYSTAAWGLFGRQQTAGHVYILNPAMLTETHRHHSQRRGNKKSEMSRLCDTDSVPVEAILMWYYTREEKFKWSTRNYKTSCQMKNLNDSLSFAGKFVVCEISAS